MGFEDGDVTISQDSADLFFDAPETLTQCELETISLISEESDGDLSILDDGVEGENWEVVYFGGEKVEMAKDGINGDVVDLEDSNMTVDGNPESKVQRKVLKPRSYQLEMLEESLNRNIIVAMDTGSGKTQIAVLRIAKELERAPPDKLIWFMAPTVALCEQQFHVLEEQLPFVQIKFFSGADNVDRWSTQELWDEVLRNVRVVVSTYQILLDALWHAFVPLERTALLVFDEAHNCVKSSPGSQIMRDFYMPKFIQREPVPHILGLSASPIMKSIPESLSMIETTLNAICRTPKKHRSELLNQVKLPELRRTFYTPESIGSPHCATETLASLHRVYEALDVEEDPYVLKLKSEDTDKSRRNLAKARRSRGTYTQDQFKTLCMTSVVICEELGEWAADFYVSSAIARFTNLTNSPSSYLEGFDIKEKEYLAAALARVHISEPSTAPGETSDKVCQFIKILLEVNHPEFSGIVFVKQRATVAVLAHLLSTHPETKDAFRIGTFVGTSQDPKRITNIGDVLDVKYQEKALAYFRSGAINLIVATSALEEGIDVPSCNAVLCFNAPDNLKVLVQRRGRARSRESKLILMVDSGDTRVERWLEFEKYMKKVYADDMRKLGEIESLENLYEDDHREFRIKTTGALLNLDNATHHLYHYCATLPADKYVDVRPDFIFTPADDGFMKARVILPICVHEKFREAEGLKSWPSENDATRDVAYEACLMLYNGGQLNDHFLPLLTKSTIPESLKKKIEKGSTRVDVSAQFEPWAELWKDQKQPIFHKSMVRLESEMGENLAKMEMVLPTLLPEIPIAIYWDAVTTLKVTISPLPLGCAAIREEDIVRGRIETNALLRAAFGHCFKFERSDFATALFLTDSPEASELLTTPMHRLASDFSFFGIQDNYPLVIRDSLSNNLPCLYRTFLASKPPEITVRRLQQDYASFEQDVPYLVLKPLSKRADFLHVVPPHNQAVISNKPHRYVLPASVCMVDKLPFGLLQFALLVPSILHKIQVHMVTDTLAKTILRDVGFSSYKSITTAISAPAAREENNYQRLEFLGDSVLKFCTAIQLLASQPEWHEGYLSDSKDRFVCNARLARAATESGLDEFILTKPFTGSKWMPTYISDLVAAHEAHKAYPKRQLSMKMLADVVEALLGAAMLDGGIPRVVECLRVLVPPEVEWMEWMPVTSNRDILFNLTPDAALPPPFVALEALIGYNFQKKALLIEAMTHVSYTKARSSLERLEFLGDSILDKIITDKIFNHNKQLPVHRMHLLRTALVNADFLAFKCMEFSIEQERTELITENQKSGKVKVGPSSNFSIPLWSFMNHNAPQIAKAQQLMKQRHALSRDAINHAFLTHDKYPWIPLQRLHAPKFFSDIVESLIGAIWIDSGSLEVCEGLLERMGILPYMRWCVEDDVHVLHPKEELGRLADAEKVRYVILRSEEKKKREEEGFGCEVFVGERLVARCGGERDRELVMGVAAEVAVGVLKEEMGNRA